MELVSRIVREYSGQPQVEAIALAGSQTGGNSDPYSDLDFYVYLNEELPLSQRERIAQSFAEFPETGNTFFEPGDEWVDAGTGIGVDVMFRHTGWIEGQLIRILEEHQASTGYSTCFWHNILFSRILFDRSGWLSALCKTADRPYPEPLRRAIINKNFPILRNTQSSYLSQLQKAVDRGDLVSVQHRVTAIIASYFDVLFAINRIPHPGEKRLVQTAELKCKRLPRAMKERINALLTCSSEMTVLRANALIDDLEPLVDETIENQ